MENHIGENGQREVSDKKQEILNNTSPPIKMITSCKVVCYPNCKWTEVKDNRPKKNNEAKGKEQGGS